MPLPLLPLVLCCCLSLDAPPPVPDPIGLGERLALIDHLRDTYGIQVPPGETLEQLQARYAAAWRVRQPAAVEADQTAQDADVAQRIRRMLKDRWQVEPPAGADLATLRAERDRLLAADAAHSRVSIIDNGPATPVPAKPAIAAAAPAAVAVADEPQGARLLRLQPPAGAHTAFLATEGTVTGLFVIFGVDHNGALRGLPEALWSSLRGAGHIRRAVLLLGHGDGTAIGGTDLEPHLKANRQFYETLGGTAPAQRVDCLLFASCSEGHPVQMRHMRDGLGYYPTWRVATGDRSLATGASVLAAFQAIVHRPPEPAFRGIFRFRADAPIASMGEVGADGERANLAYFRIVADPQAPYGFRVEEQR